MSSLFTRFFLILASCVFATHVWAQEAAQIEKITPMAAPAISYANEKGEMKKLAPKENKLTIVHFWATWCAPCVAELPQVDAVAKAYASKGVEVVALSLDGSGNMDKVQQFIASHHITNLTAYIDRNNFSFRAFKGDGLPTSVFIDKDGQVIARVEGPLNWKSPETLDFINANLK